MTDPGRLKIYEGGVWRYVAMGPSTNTLSNLTIDTAKDWQGYAVTNLGDITSNGIITGTTLVIDGTVDCTLTATDAGQLFITNPSGYVQIGPNGATYCYFSTDRPQFAFNKHIILYNSNIYDIGSTSYLVRNIYLGTGGYMNGSQFINSSRDLMNIGDITTSGVVSTAGTTISGVNHLTFYGGPYIYSPDAGNLNVNVASGYGTRLQVDGTTHLTVNASGIAVVGSIGCGAITTTSSITLDGTVDAVLYNSGGALRITSSYGNITVGCLNAGACHIYSDNSVFAFNKPLDPSVTENFSIGDSSHIWGNAYIKYGYFNGYIDLTATSGQIRSDSTIGLNNVAGTGYQSLGIYSLNIGTTTVIDNARSLTNITNISASGTLGCGAITSTSTVQGTQIIGTNNGTMDCFKVGDDAYIGDCNVANFIGIKGSTAANGGIIFGSGADTDVYRAGANWLHTDDYFGATKNVMFSAHESGKTTPGTATVLLPFQTEEYDPNGVYTNTASNYKFTAPVAGYYHVHAQIRWNTPTANGVNFIYLYKNGSQYACGGAYITTTNTYVTSVIDVNLLLAANDYLQIYGAGLNSAQTIGQTAAPWGNWFGVELLSRSA